MLRQILTLIPSVFMLASLAAAESPQELLNMAAAKVNLQKLAPVRLAASFRLGKPPGQEGMYVLLVDERGRWRDEIALLDFAEARVSSEPLKVRRVQRGSKRIAPVADAVRELIGHYSLLLMRPELRLERVIQHKGKGASAISCIQRKRADLDEQLCFDASNHYVGDSKKTKLYDFRAIGDLDFPFSMESTVMEQPLRISINAIEKTSIEERSFITGSQAKEAIGCLFPQRGFVIEFHQSPASPPNVTGLVLVEGHFGVDGNSTGTEISSGHPALLRLSQDYVSRWRVAPNLCGGQPVVTDLSAGVYFGILGHHETSYRTLDIAPVH